MRLICINMRRCSTWNIARRAFHVEHTLQCAAPAAALGGICGFLRLQTQKDANREEFEDGGFATMLESSRPPSAAGAATCSHPASGRQNVPRGTMPSPALAYIFMLNRHFNLYIHALVCIFIHVPPLRPHWGVFVTSCRFRGKKAQIGRSSRMVALPPCSKAPDPPVQQGRQRVSEAVGNLLRIRPE